MLIAFAGLPGTGKTTLATRVAERMGGILLNKDRVRAALFAAGQIEYSRRQDDFCMAVLYQVAEYHLRGQPERAVLIDGRTFSQAYQIDDLRACAERSGVGLKIIECTCAEETALRRLEADHQAGTHEAADRDAGLYHRVKAQWQAISGPHLVVATDEVDLDDAVTQVLAYVQISE